MTAAYPRPAKRIIDKDLMRQLHLEMKGEPCEVCEIRIGEILHHVKYRSRGGDDTRANLLWVCPVCDSDHAALPSVSRYG